jgi:alkanesulfonate monooxygenase SsuD/methylene tetrahydromethanopterin reductase-like flavin-dependent oxidoreductase (luciferase family)
MGAGSPASITMVAERGYNLLLDQYCTIAAAIERVAHFRSELEKRGGTFEPTQVGVARGLFVANNAEEREAAMQKRVEARARIDALAQRPDGNNRSSLMDFADTRAVAEEGALFGTPDEIAEKLERMRKGGIEYVLLTDAGGGSEGLRRFAREIMPAFAGSPPAKAAE